MIASQSNSHPLRSLLYDSIRNTVPLTLHLSCLVVHLAEELLVVHEVELIARVQLPATDDAAKTVEVVDVVLGATDDVGGRDKVAAAAAFRTELSEIGERSIQHSTLIADG